MLRGWKHAGMAGVGFGGTLLVWMLVQISILGLVAAIQAVYVGLGLAETGLGLVLLQRTLPENTGERVVRGITIVLTALVGLTALAGGIELAVWSQGAPWMPTPVSALEGTPFSSFLVPGLLLAGVVAALNLWATFGLLRRQSGVGADCMVAGAAISTWILVEMALLGTHDTMELVYLVAGWVTLGAGAWLTGPPALPRQVSPT